MEYTHFIIRDLGLGVKMENFRVRRIEPAYYNPVWIIYLFLMSFYHDNSTPAFIADQPTNPEVSLSYFRPINQTTE